KLANDSSHTISSANESGTYRLVLENEYGCVSDTSKTKTITIHQSPQMETINPSSATLCNGESIPLYIPLRSGVNYKWYKNNILQAGANNNTLNIEKEGNYIVEISNNFCSVVSEPSAITVLTIPKPELNYTGVVETCPSGEITLELEDKLTGYQYTWSDGTSAGTNFQYSQPFENKQYWITRSKSGCENTSDTVKIKTTSDLDSAHVTVFGNTIWYIGCSNKNIAAYQWYKNGKPILDEKDKICMVGAVNGSDTLYYQVKVTDIYGCTAWSGTEKIYADRANFKSASGLKLPTQLEVYPNPNDGNFTIKVESLYLGEVRIAVYNSTGKVVFLDIFKKSVYSTSNDYKLELTPGIYSFQIITGTNVWAEHLVVE
ncbi:MAG: T9SS type A sorting domain-containing protein, partial [Bacteroidales bacterium]|nr:T9SS type A sorting domain-containing protein [Bacteroidales bacterium]